MRLTTCLVACSVPILAVALSAGRSAVGEVDAAPEPLVVFCVRHAEKAAGEDPELTKAGTERAAALAAMLRDAGIVHVHSTDTARTRKTAAPTAKRLGLEIETYDAGDLRRLLDGIKKTGGRHLVVGHSNTTPSVVRMLGGDCGPPIAESEYDRLYVVTVLGKKVTTVLLRF